MSSAALVVAVTEIVVVEDATEIGKLISVVENCVIQQDCQLLLMILDE